MRITDILGESVDAIDEVIDEIITSFVAMGKTEISTSKLASLLTSRTGATVSTETLVPLLTDHPMVTSATEMVITVGEVDDDSGFGDPADGNDEDRVSQMADGAVDLGD